MSIITPVLRFNSILVFILCFVLPAPVFALVNKSGVDPSVLSFPSGPGSIEGLGSSFVPRLNTGTVQHNIPIKVPKGRNGFEPSLSFAYSNGFGNGVTGVGWKLSGSYIERYVDKRVPFYTERPNPDGIDNDKDGAVDEQDEFDRLIYVDSGDVVDEIVPISATEYRLEKSTIFAKIEKTVSGGWQVKGPTGTTRFYGLAPESRILNPQSNVLRWLLQYEIDSNGNRIEYTYVALDTSAQRYLQKIRYNILGGNFMEVACEYGFRPDVLTDFKGGFELKTAYRLKDVVTRQNSRLIRRYSVGYAAVSDIQNLSLLNSITEYGTDNVTGKPPVTFTYVEFSSSSAAWASMPSAPNLSLGGNIELMDINADGLPDILNSYNSTISTQSFYINMGSVNSTAPQWSAQNYMARSGGQQLSLPGMLLGDISGDGVVDLLDNTGSKSWYFRINKANLSWELAGEVGQPAFNLKDDNTRLVDMDNDKDVDVLGTYSGLNYVWLNQQGSLWSNAMWVGSPNSILSLANSSVRLADMNGDGLQDIVQIMDAYTRFYPSLGYGRFGKEVTMLFSPSGIYNQKFAYLQDVNGDGLADLAYLSGNTLNVWINRGYHPDWHAYNYGYFAATPVQMNLPYVPSASMQVRQADMNGNGSVDFLVNQFGMGSQTFTFLDFAPGEQPYQLKTCNNGIGSTTTFSYRALVQEMVRDEAASNVWSSKVPLPLQVLTQTAVSDGLTNVEKVEHYNYHDGYYDPIDREFGGFQRSEQLVDGDRGQGAAELLIKNVFDVGSSEKILRGQLLVQQSGDANAVHVTQQNTWIARLVNNGLLGLNKPIKFAELTLSTKDIVESGIGVPVSIVRAYQYDDFGNQVEIAESSVGAAAFSDYRITKTRYSADNATSQAAWQLSHPIQKTVEDIKGISAKTEWFYDDESFSGSNYGVVTKGNLTLKRDWDPSSGTKFVDSIRNQYDVWGNIKTTYGALWGREPGHMTALEYDPEYQTYVVKESIDTGKSILVAGASYDYGVGAMTMRTDFNGQLTSYYYDNFGRLAKIVVPGDSIQLPTVQYDYQLVQPVGLNHSINWISTFQRERSGFIGTLDSRTFYDGLGREVMNRQEGEVAGRVVVSHSTLYNSRQLPYRQYSPYFESGNLDYPATLSGQDYSEMTYDALGREIRKYLPIVAGKTHFTETEYRPQQIIIRDAEQTDPTSPRYGSYQSLVYDGLDAGNKLGRLRYVEDWVKTTDQGVSGPLTAWTTEYVYDSLNNLRRLVDAQGNEKILDYNGLGQETAHHDPDHGTMVYGYDDAGNIRYTIDAKNQEITYAYDGANRLIAEFSFPVSRQIPGIVPTTAPDVQYFYDVAPAAVLETGKTANNTLGRLTGVIDNAGEAYQSYDERGRIKWEARKFNVSLPAGVPLYSVSEHEYDAANREVALTYPDGSRADYIYNGRGLIESIPNVAPRLEYNATGQLTHIELANTVATDYHRDSWQRIERIHSWRNDGLKLQDLSYSFDAVSNVIGLVDNRTAIDLDRIAADLGISSARGQLFRDTAQYQYDDIYRLTNVTNASIGYIDYRYDRIGNMLEARSGLSQANYGGMSYGGSPVGSQVSAWNRSPRVGGDAAGPHALTDTQLGGSISASTVTLAYDANGNVETFAGKKIVWDIKNRIESAYESGTSVKYLYDHNNIRKVKSVTDNAGTLYDLHVDNFSEYRDGKLIKYVYAGDNRLARSSAASVGGFVPDYFYLTQQVGSTALTLDSQARAVEAIAYLPFGDEYLNSRLSAIDKDATPYRFGGKEKDRETGFNYFEQRYLTAALGRFISTDPVTVSADRFTDPQAWNSYAYARNNPLRYVDPTGEFFWVPIMVAVWAADKAYAAYEAHQDYKAIQAGTKTIEDVVKDRVVEQAAGAAFGAAGRVAVKATKAVSKALVKTPKIGCSFSPDTEVVTERGPLAMNALEVGDTVLGRAADGNEASYAVAGIMTRWHDAKLVLTVMDQNGETSEINTTEEHPFFQSGVGWKAAGALQIGDELSAAGHTPVWVTQSRHVNERFIAYDIDVEPADNFFVGPAGVLVHNVDCDVAKGPKVGGGGTLDKLSPSEIKRIQNAANRSGQDIGVVGSRVNPNKPLHSKSDYDFVIDANSKTRNNLSSSLPGAKNVREGIPNNQDIFKGTVDTSKPHVIFRPE